MDGQVKQILCINQSQEPRVICLSKYSTADLENLSQVCVCVHSCVAEGQTGLITGAI